MLPPSLFRALFMFNVTASQSTSPMSVSRCPRCRFGGCESTVQEAISLNLLPECLCGEKRIYTCSCKKSCHAAVSFLIYSYLCLMNVMKRRLISFWVQLAVFLPIFLLSSFQTHGETYLDGNVIVVKQDGVFTPYLAMTDNLGSYLTVVDSINCHTLLMT